MSNIKRGFILSTLYAVFPRHLYLGGLKNSLSSLYEGHRGFEMDIAYLEQSGLIRVLEEPGLSRPNNPFRTATLTPAGIDVAEGATEIPGIDVAEGATEIAGVKQIPVDKSAIHERPAASSSPPSSWSPPWWCGPLIERAVRLTAPHAVMLTPEYVIIQDAQGPWVAKSEEILRERLDIIEATRG